MGLQRGRLPPTKFLMAAIGPTPSTAPSTMLLERPRCRRLVSLSTARFALNSFMASRTLLPPTASPSAPSGFLFENHGWLMASSMVTRFEGSCRARGGEGHGQGVEVGRAARGSEAEVQQRGRVRGCAHQVDHLLDEVNYLLSSTYYLLRTKHIICLMRSLASLETLSTLGKVYRQSTIAWCVCMLLSRLQACGVAGWRRRVADWRRMVAG